MMYGHLERFFLVSLAIVSIEYGCAAAQRRLMGWSWAFSLAASFCILCATDKFRKQP